MTTSSKTTGPKYWTVAQSFAHAVKNFSNHPFLQIVNGNTHSYAEALLNVERFASALLSLEVQPTDKVILMLPNSPGAVYGWLACNFINATEVSINTGYKGATLEHAINLTQARICITVAKYLPTILASKDKLTTLQVILLIDEEPYTTPPNTPITIKRLSDIHSTAFTLKHTNLSARPQDIASIIYTSGTSGPAKGVQMPHAQVCLLAHLATQKMDLSSNDVFFSFYPMYHMAGKFMCVLASILVGARVVLDIGFEPSTWLQKIRDYQATVTAAHGPMLEMVYAQPPNENDKNHNLRLIRSAPFPKHIAQEFQQRFNVTGMEVWGMTETGVVCWSNPHEPLRIGSCGKPDKDWFEFLIADPQTDLPVATGQTGQILIRPKQPWIISAGYLGMPEQTLEVWRNLWFHTGDSAYQDEQGYVYFVDRLSDSIRRKAENISATDVENGALSHPAIEQAAACAIPSGREHDDEILLCYVTKENQVLEPRDLLKHMVHALPHFMVPRYLCKMTTLPRTITGKLQRKKLTEKFQNNTQELWDRKQHAISIRELLNS